MTGSNLQTDDPLAKRPAENRSRGPEDGRDRPVWFVERLIEGHRRPNGPFHDQTNVVIVFSF